MVRLNRALHAALRDVPQLAGWTTKELERFLYFWADPREARRIVKIAPGEDARFWEECCAGGYICVGWDEVGDLRDFESKDSFRASFDQVYASVYNNHRPTLTKKANELWILVELEPGDIIVANKEGLHAFLWVSNRAQGPFRGRRIRRIAPFAWPGVVPGWGHENPCAPS